MKLNKKAIYLITASSLLILENALAIEFDTSLLAGASRESDLSRFYINSDMPAGTQEVDIYVNNNWKGRYPLQFGDTRDDINISYQDATLLGIDIADLPAPKDGRAALPIASLVQGGNFDLEVGSMSLRLTVPQSHLLHSEAGYVDPKFWDRGVSALMLSYNTTYYAMKSKQGGKEATDDFYTGLESGFNLIGWQLRDNSSYRRASGQNGKWQNNTLYVQKGFASIKSNITAGDFYSPGELFDSLRIRGVSLASDINMRPNSQQGFSPVVHGVAQTNALVKVIQSGNVVYQENVPPGTFVLDNIQPMGASGDLLVVVKEADGRERSFTVPFSSVPSMLKKGVNKYSLLAGEVKQANTDYQPGFVQGTLQYGFNNLVTGYAGGIISDDYFSYLLGSGWNLPIGAVSLEVTQANTSLKDRRESGQSFRIAYSRFLNATATNFTLSAYRYSTKGYYSFSDAIHSHEGYRQFEKYARDWQENTEGGKVADWDMDVWDALRSARPHNTLNLNLNQRLDDGRGTVYFSGIQRDYWNESGKTREYQLGYSNTYFKVSYNVSASRVLNASPRQEETRYYVSVSLPLSMFDTPVYLSSGMTATKSHYQQSNVSLSGSALGSNRLSYTVAAGNQRGGSNMNSANAAYRTSFSTLGASYSESSDYRQEGLSAYGSLVAIPWHVLASNEIGKTMTVVDAPKAAGLMINGDESIITNSEGLALVYATPYRENSVTLSGTDNSRGAEIIGNIVKSVPYAGAVNYLRFETDKRQSYTIRAYKSDGKPLPFGAEVLDDVGESIGYVGQASILYLRADHEPDALAIHLRNGSCRINKPSLAPDAAPSVCQ